MLFIDIVNIIYLAIGIAVGAILITVVDYMTCVECYASILDMFDELEEGDITNDE